MYHYTEMLVCRMFVCGWFVGGWVMFFGVFGVCFFFLFFLMGYGCVRRLKMVFAWWLLGSRLERYIHIFFMYIYKICYYNVCGARFRVVLVI